MYNDSVINMDGVGSTLHEDLVEKKKNSFGVFFRKYKVFFIVFCALFVIGVGFLAFRIFYREKNELVVLVAPEIAEIKIDGKIYKNGVSKVSSGVHFAEISAAGFEPTEFEFEVDGDEPYTLTEALVEREGSYTEADYEILSLIAESEELIAKVNERARAKTIFDRLPIEESVNGVVISNASGSEECSKDALCLSIESRENLSDEDVAKLIRSYGYDPNYYEIYFAKKENE